MQEQGEQKEQKRTRQADLTRRQVEALNSFAAMVERNRGVPPSIEELALEMGVKKATANGFLKVLLRKGFLEKGGSTRATRNLFVVRSGR